MIDLLIAPAYAAEAAKDASLFTQMTTDPKWFIFYGLLVFFGVVWRAGGFRAITGMLDARAKRIETELNDAKALREQAAALLADYKAKHAQAEAEAARIVAQAKDDADALRAQAAKDLEAELKRRDAMTAERIARAESQAKSEVRTVAAEAAIEAAERMLKARLTGADHVRLVAEGAKDLPRKFG